MGERGEKYILGDRGEKYIVRDKWEEYIVGRKILWGLRGGIYCG